MQKVQKRYMHLQNSLLLTMTIMLADRRCQGNKKARCIVTLTAEWVKDKTLKFEMASMAVTLGLPSSGM